MTTGVKLPEAGLELAQRVSICDQTQSLAGRGVEVFADEADRTVGEQNLQSAGVEAAWAAPFTEPANLTAVERRARPGAAFPVVDLAGATAQVGEVDRAAGVGAARPGGGVTVSDVQGGFDHGDGVAGAVATVPDVAIGVFAKHSASVLVFV